LNCFNKNLNVSAVLLLGVAAEAFFSKFCDIFLELIPEGPQRKEFQGKRFPKEKHRWIVQRYETKAQEEKTLRQIDGLDLSLKSIYDLIRRQRNELGHPADRIPEVTRQKAFCYFVLFADLVFDIGEFVKYCREYGI